MKIQFVTAVWLAALLTVSTVAYATDRLPGKYFLSIAEVYGSSPQEHFFLVGGVDSTRFGGQIVCKSLASLEKLLSGLPRGSTLDWYPPDSDPEQSEFLKNSDVAELKAICAKAGVRFTRHPGG